MGKIISFPSLHLSSNFVDGVFYVVVFYQSFIESLVVAFSVFPNIFSVWCHKIFFSKNLNILPFSLTH